MNTHTLSKVVDQAAFVAELITAGVTSHIAIGGDRVTLSGPVWDAMTDEAQTAELALVASTETAHIPDTVTEVTLNAAPHSKLLRTELMALAGVTQVSVHCPPTYPGTCVVYHNALTGGQQAALSTAVTNHDPTAAPKLSVDTAAQVIAADNVDTGTVTVTDSRGAAAAGKTVRLRIPSGGDAAVDADAFVLDAAGKATATFQVTTTFTGELTFEFYYANGEADPITFTVRRGTA